MHVDHFQRLATTASHTGERIFSHHDRDTGLFHQQAIQVTQQCATTGQHHTAFGDVGSQFRRALFQRNHDRADDAGQRFLQSFENFIGVHGEATRHTFSQVTATHFNFTHFVIRIGRADAVLDTFCSSFTDQ
ncbi:hypothetical protein D3C79_855200 [compost metagenome]